MTSIDPGNLAERRDAIVAQHGSWMEANLDLGGGVYTMAPGLIGATEERVRRIIQVVADLAKRPLDHLRILDLGAYEGSFAIALAQRGAEVVAVEARERHTVKMTFVKEILGLDRLTVVQGNVREISQLVSGPFDVILCLGVLYHLDAEGVFGLVSDLRHLARDFVVFETNVSLARSHRVKHDGREYAGKLYPENVGQPGAAVDTPNAFWPTRSSLLNLLADVGFSSVHEVLSPVFPELAMYRDHVTLLAAAGDTMTIEDVDEHRWPERVPPAAHPTQGLRWSVLERIRRRRGGGLNALFLKRAK